jgi:hypothetical protein
MAMAPPWGSATTSSFLSVSTKRGFGGPTATGVPQCTEIGEIGEATWTRSVTHDGELCHICVPREPKLSHNRASREDLQTHHWLYGVSMVNAEIATVVGEAGTILRTTTGGE